jgi:hypothetical protein
MDEHTMLVLMSREFLDGSLWGLRTADGRKITVEFGEPVQENGYQFYEPVFTTHEDEWYRDRVRGSEVLYMLREIKKVLAE